MQLSTNTKSRKSKAAPAKATARPTKATATKATANKPKAPSPKAHASAKASKSKPKAAPARPPQYPDALVDFMMKDWEPRRVAVEPLPHVAALRARRAAVGAAFPRDILVVPTGHERTRANDTVYRFRPGSDFFYLTGNLEPDCVLVMLPLQKPKKGGPTHEEILFVEPNPGRSDKTFFTDHAKGELWVGPRLGVAESATRFGVETCKAIGDLASILGRATKRPAGAVRVLRGLSESTEKLCPARSPKDAELAQVLSEIRLIKDAQEIVELRNVVDSTKRGFEDVIRGLKRAKTERDVEGAFNTRARVEGNDCGYNTIAAGGANACILHWTRNDASLDKSELLLLDAGVEGNQLYTADITRTLPMSGKFSPAQREVYALVERAQAAALDEVKPGNDFMEPNRAAQRVLAEGLEKMGILADAAHALRADQQLYRRYTLHNTSHMLGLDVHDCAKARQEVYRYGKLRPGMVLTVEPGLYFQPDDKTVPAKYRGIGVRIEDDVLVTETGMDNLSDAIPRRAEAVEAWMAQVWADDAR